MVRVRDNRQKHLARHIVTTVPVRPGLPLATVRMSTLLMPVARRKEAAP
jgi:hypothetical protein